MVANLVKSGANNHPLRDADTWSTDRNHRQIKIPEPNWFSLVTIGKTDMFVNYNKPI